MTSLLLIQQITTNLPADFSTKEFGYQDDFHGLEIKIFCEVFSSDSANIFETCLTKAHSISFPMGL